MQQLVALQGYSVVFVDECSGTLVTQTHVRWDGLMIVVGFIHVFVQFVEQCQLCVGFCQTLAELIGIRYCLCGVYFQFHHLVALLEVLQFTFCVAQFGVDFLQTVVDELLCAYGNEVLVFVGLSVVDDS